MKSTFFVSTLLLAANTLVSVTASPIDDKLALINEKRQSQNQNAVGVTGGTGTRLELRTMQQRNPTLYALYMLGLQEFKNVDPTDPLSYYQIAGIHGRPYTAWDGDSVNGGSGYGAGYCTHVSNLFLPWHRPYLALFEQQLYSHVQNVARGYSASVQNAARNFRIPYWDWAAPNCAGCKPFPSLITSFTIDITLDGRTRTLSPNPLFRYTFNDSPQSRANDMVFSPFTVWAQTERSPTNGLNTDSVSNNAASSQAIANNQASLRSRIYNLLTNYPNFNSFSNEAANPGGNSDSLESVHDQIHSLTGGGGDMTYLDYSAFDPVFWLHHANVDRFYALWQNIYGDSSYVPVAAQTASNYWYQQGQQLGPDAGLQPFRASNGQYWTSNTVRRVSTFGYTYPELIDTSRTVKAAVNALYNGGQGSNTKKHKKAKKNRRDLISGKAEELGIKGDSSDDQHYILNIVSQKFQLRSTYNIFIFLGEVPDQVSEWGSSGNFVGSHAVLANLMHANSSGDFSQVDLKVTGSVPLTAALQDIYEDGGLDSLAVSDVEPFLRDNLSWRIALPDNTEVPITSLSDFSATVVTAHVTPAASIDEFPIWGAWAGLPNCTFGQPGGHDDAYWEVPAHQTHFSIGSNIKLGFNA